MCTYNAHANTQIIVNPVPRFQRHWDELAEICSDIMRAAEFRDAARFRGNMIYTHVYRHMNVVKPRHMCEGYGSHFVSEYVCYHASSYVQDP